MGNTAGDRLAGAVSYSPSLFIRCSFLFISGAAGHVMAVENWWWWSLMVATNL